MQSNEIADRIDELKRHAAELYCAINGLEVLNDHMRSCVSHLAYELSTNVRKLSDQVCPVGKTKIKAVAS
jgi:hypothetical protein